VTVTVILNKICVNNERNDQMEFSKNTRLWDILFRHLTAMGVSGKSLLTHIEWQNSFQGDPRCFCSGRKLDDNRLTHWGALRSRVA
jgi:hypothetical protein